MDGTNTPSMTSMCRYLAPAASASFICSPSLQKSAARIDGDSIFILIPLARLRRGVYTPSYGHSNQYLPFDDRPPGLALKIYFHTLLSLTSFYQICYPAATKNIQKSRPLMGRLISLVIPPTVPWPAPHPLSASPRNRGGWCSTGDISSHHSHNAAECLPAPGHRLP